MDRCENLLEGKISSVGGGLDEGVSLWRYKGCPPGFLEMKG